MKPIRYADFELDEYQQRIARADRIMGEHGLDALIRAVSDVVGIGNISNERTAVAEVYRVLQPDGDLLATEMVVDSEAFAKMP